MLPRDRKPGQEYCRANIAVVDRQLGRPEHGWRACTKKGKRQSLTG